MITNYRSRYGYPLRWAILAELWWRLEHLPYRGDERGRTARFSSYAYRHRKEAERRGYAATLPKSAV